MSYYKVINPKKKNTLVKLEKCEFVETESVHIILELPVDKSNMTYLKDLHDKGYAITGEFVDRYHRYHFTNKKRSLKGYTIPLALGYKGES